MTCLLSLPSQERLKGIVNEHRCSSNSKHRCRPRVVGCARVDAAHAGGCLRALAVLAVLQVCVPCGCALRHVPYRCFIIARPPDRQRPPVPAQVSAAQAPPPPFDFTRVQALVHRAGLASSHKDHAESARLYTQASELMGGAVNVVLEQRLGDALMHTQEYERAYRAYARSFSVSPQQAGIAPAAHALSLARGAAAAFYTHRRSKALKLLQTILETDALGLLYAVPARAGAALAWATAAHLGGFGDPERALVDRHRFLKVFSTVLSMMNTLGH